MTSKKKKQKKEDVNKEPARPDPETEAAETPSAGPEPARAEEKELDGEPALDELYIRLKADFENFRKRTFRERDQIYRRANEDLMTELLPVLDHIDLAFSAVDEHDAHSAFVEGFKLVSDQLLTALGKFGLKPLSAEEGDFDPHFHEAVSHLDSETVPENKIIAQVRKGYTLGERLLRPAQVVVSRGAPEKSGEEYTPAEE